MPPPKANNAPAPMASTNRGADVKPPLTPSTSNRHGAICLRQATELAAAGGERANGEATTSAGAKTNSTSTSHGPGTTAARGSVNSPSGGARRGAISVESLEELETAVPRIVQGRGTLFGASGGEAGDAGSVPEDKGEGGEV